MPRCFVKRKAISFFFFFFLFNANDCILLTYFLTVYRHINSYVCATWYIKKMLLLLLSKGRIAILRIIIVMHFWFGFNLFSFSLGRERACNHKWGGGNAWMKLICIRGNAPSLNVFSTALSRERRALTLHSICHSTSITYCNHIFTLYFLYVYKNINYLYAND